MRGRFRSLVAVAVWSLAVGCCCAQKPPSLGENRLLALMPELRKLSSPSWVKEGLRVNYYAASATLPADRFYYYKDAKGNLARGEEVGPAGGGISQYTVIARTATSVIGNLDTYMQDIGSGMVVPSYLSGTVDPAGAGAVWANPAALAKATRFQDRELRVMKAPYPLNGKTYQSIRFHYVSARAVTDDVYDLASGLWLFHGSVVLSADGRYTQLTQVTYRSRRQLALPVASPAAPAFLGQTKQFAFQGAISVMVPGSPVFPQPVSLVLRKTGGGERWARYDVSSQTPGQMPSDRDMLCGAGQLPGEPWVSPSLLKNLTPGQILDRDPDVPFTVQVEGVQPGPRGEVVLVTNAGPGYKRTYAYERASGRELMVTTLQQVGAAVQQTQLQWVP